MPPEKTEIRNNGKLQGGGRAVFLKVARREVIQERREEHLAFIVLTAEGRIQGWREASLGSMEGASNCKSKISGEPG